MTFMLSLETQSLGRFFLYALALAIIGASLAYSNYLAGQLAKKERSIVMEYSEALQFFGTFDIADDPQAAADKALEFIFLNSISKTDERIPRILVGENDSIESFILNFPQDWEVAVQKEKAREKLEEFKIFSQPIKIEFAPGRFQYVYYGESDLLRNLRWFPVIQLIVAFAFIGIVLFSYSAAKRSQQNKVWVGMAKETAHQLGTPVSSLMGWVELMKLKDLPDSDMVQEMEEDVKRLENITERFSKIGSQPELVAVDLNEVLRDSSDYLHKRMSKKGDIHLTLNNEIPATVRPLMNRLLFDWVIENLLKNALDAMKSAKGTIDIHSAVKGKEIYIDVSDSGKGIPKANFKKVFEPGFTTKKRGWGLGLSLSKRIIENYHKGKIFVKSSEIGKGTTFRIILPLQKKR